MITDPFWVAGVVAYWSEGAKKHGSLKFSNSDPELIAVFIRWLGVHLGVGIDRLTPTLHLHTGQCEDERKHYWSAITGIPVEQFGKTFIKKEGTGHRKNLLYNGTVSIRVRRSGALLQRVLGWTEAMTSLGR